MVTTFEGVGEYQRFVVLDEGNGILCQKVKGVAFQVSDTQRGLRNAEKGTSLPPDTKVIVVYIPRA